MGGMVRRVTPTTARRESDISPKRTMAAITWWFVLWAVRVWIQSGLVWVSVAVRWMVICVYIGCGKERERETKTLLLLSQSFVGWRGLISSQPPTTRPPQTNHTHLLVDRLEVVGEAVEDPPHGRRVVPPCVCVCFYGAYSCSVCVAVWKQPVGTWIDKKKPPIKGWAMPEGSGGFSSGVAGALVLLGVLCRFLHTLLSTRPLISQNTNHKPQTPSRSVVYPLTHRRVQDRL